MYSERLLKYLNRRGIISIAQELKSDDYEV